MERVAHISLHGDPLEPLGSIEAGGQNVYVRNVAAELARRGVRTDVFTRWNCPSKARVEEIAPGARSVRLQGGPRAFLKKETVIERLPELLHDFMVYSAQNGLRYDLIHTHYYVEGAFGLELSGRLGVPHLHTFHSLGRVKHNHERLQGAPDAAAYAERFDIEKRLMTSCDRLVATSPFEAEDFRDWYGHDNANTVVVPCGVDPELFVARERLGARQALGLPADRTILLYVGRLDPRKGLETLLFAYRKLIFDLGDRADEVMLVVVGGSGSEEVQDAETLYFRELAASLQLGEVDLRRPDSGRILFAGSQPQAVVANYYAAADMTLVPSCYEPFGMVAIETQACGTPAIASAVGGLRYAVEDGVGGLLVKPYSAVDLCEKMHLLVSDPGLRIELGLAGRRRVLEQFTWKAVGEALHATYDELLQESRRPAPPLRPPQRKSAVPSIPFHLRSTPLGGVPASSPLGVKVPRY